jgi:hypothetical protein
MLRGEAGLASAGVGFGLQGVALSPLLQLFHKCCAHSEPLGHLSDSLSFVRAPITRFCKSIEYALDTGFSRSAKNLRRIQAHNVSMPAI